MIKLTIDQELKAVKKRMYPLFLETISMLKAIISFVRQASPHQEATNEPLLEKLTNSFNTFSKANKFFVRSSE